MRTCQVLCENLGAPLIRSIHRSDAVETIYNMEKCSCFCIHVTALQLFLQISITKIGKFTDKNKQMEGKGWIKGYEKAGSGIKMKTRPLCCW